MAEFSMNSFILFMSEIQGVFEAYSLIRGWVYDQLPIVSGMRVIDVFFWDNLFSQIVLIRSIIFFIFRRHIKSERTLSLRNTV